MVLIKSKWFVLNRSSHILKLLTFFVWEQAFRGVERASSSRGQPLDIELFEQRRTLWSSSTPSTSNAGSLDVPSNLPFEFELTEDLPHCIHLPNSSVQYTFIATLIQSDPVLAPLVKRVPIHLTRFAPSDILVVPLQASESCSFSPTIINLSHPFEVKIQLSPAPYSGDLNGFKYVYSNSVPECGFSNRRKVFNFVVLG